MPDGHRPRLAAPSPLSMDGSRFRALGGRAVEIAARHLETLPASPVVTPIPQDELRDLREAAMPDTGVDEEAILAFLAQRVMPYPLGNGHPRFFAWITSAPAPIGILADLLAATLNANCGAGDHAAAVLEDTVTRWLMELVGFPADGSRGMLVSGGSMANLTALAVARQWAAARIGTDVREAGTAAVPGLVLYQSAETHSCIRKAAELLGLGGNRLRTIPVDRDLRIRTDALAQAIAADRAAGLVPFCVVATAGTVNSGAIDPLGEIADLCASEGLWFHVDGAYGGIAAADPAMREVMAPLARAHSVALDPHKWLCVPIECGCVLIRDATLQHATFSLTPAYLRVEEAAPAEAWPFEFGVQLSRGPRALKAAAVLMRLGRRGVADTVARHRALALCLAARIEAADDLELTAPVPMSLVCFRYVPPGRDLDPARIDHLNHAIAEAVNRRGRVFFSPTAIGDRVSLRASIIHFDIREEDLDALLAEIRAAAADLLATPFGNRPAKGE